MLTDLIAIYFLIELYGDAISSKHCEIQIKIQGSRWGFGEKCI